MFLTLAAEPRSIVARHRFPPCRAGACDLEAVEDPQLAHGGSTARRKDLGRLRAKVLMETSAVGRGDTSVFVLRGTPEPTRLVVEVDGVPVPRPRWAELFT